MPTKIEKDDVTGRETTGHEWDGIRELNTLGSGVIEGDDIRTAEGAALFLRLASTRQDPALIESRLQTRRLTEVRDAVVGLSAQLAGPVVQIGAGAG